jgi:RimJ/RimL family protein N-acetyltransferase
VLTLDGEIDGALLPVLADGQVPVGRDVDRAWTVLDSYRATRPDVRDLVIVDDFRQRGDHGSDFVLDQNYGAERSLYPEADRVLLGPSYALLRPEFASARRSRRPLEEGIDSVVISLGGTPPPDLLDRVAAVVREQLPGATVHALDGTQTNLGDLFSSSCLAVAASGSTVWELLCCGVPTILLSVAENQDLVRTHLVDAGYCWRADVESLSATIDTVVGDPDARRSRSQRGAELVDGLGADRAVAQLRSMDVGIRPATMADADRLLSWANDPVTRSNSFSSDPIDPIDHVSWLRRVIDDVDSLLLIGEYAGRPIGQIRFDREEGRLVVSVGLGAGSRGQSLGAPLILAGVRAAQARWPVPVLARIKADNAASIRAFSVGGFGHESQDEGHGVVKMRCV